MHEYGQFVAAPLAVRAVAPDPGQALGQHAAGVVVHRLSSRSPAPSVPLARSSPSQITRRAPTWPGPSMTVATATGSPAPIAAVTSPSSGKDCG